jgi:hypothetical protein
MEKLIHISKNVFKPNKKCLALIALNVFPIWSSWATASIQ